MTSQPERLRGRLRAPATAGMGVDCYQQHGWDHLHGQMGLVKHCCMPDPKQRKKRLAAEAAVARGTAAAAGAAAATAGSAAAGAAAAAAGSAAAGVVAAAAGSAAAGAAAAAAGSAAAGAAAAAVGSAAAAVEDPDCDEGDAGEAAEQPQWGDADEETDAEEGGQGTAAALPGVSVLEWCLLRVSNRRRMAAIRAVRRLVA